MYSLQAVILAAGGKSARVPFGPHIGRMSVRLNVAKLLKKRGMTAYQLAKASGLPIASAYRLARAGGTFRRIEARTVDKLCKALHCRPGDLFVFTHD